MSLFIDERGDGAEADDVVVEEEWLPPWQELPMTERNDKSAPTGKFKKYIFIEIVSGCTSILDTGRFFHLRPIQCLVFLGIL